MYKINEINVDFEYNFVIISKSIDRIHKIRCFVKNRVDVFVHFVFVIDSKMFQNEKSFSLSNMKNDF